MVTAALRSMLGFLILQLAIISAPSFDAQTVGPPNIRGGSDYLPSDASGSFVATGISRLHYLERGQGRAVVLLHGNPGEARDFSFGTMDLIAREYHVYAFDLPGHGLSESPSSTKHTLDQQVNALHQALMNLGIRDPLLVGHSFGGSIALAYAVHYPQDLSALVLVAPSAYVDKRYDLPIHLLGMPLAGDLLIAAFKPLLGKKLLKQYLRRAFYPDPLPSEYLTYAASSWLDRRRFKVYLKDELGGGPWLRGMKQEYPKLKAPVIILTGDSDRIVKAVRNAFALHEAIAGSRLVVIPRAGHQIPVSHPDEILRAIRMVDNSPNDRQTSPPQ